MSPPVIRDKKNEITISESELNCPICGCDWSTSKGADARYKVCSMNASHKFKISSQKILDKEKK